MAKIKALLATVLGPGFSGEATQAPMPTEGRLDRIDYDLTGVSDTDAMWYYETRRWRGRD